MAASISRRLTLVWNPAVRRSYHIFNLQQNVSVKNVSHRFRSSRDKGRKGAGIAAFTTLGFSLFGYKIGSGNEEEDDKKADKLTMAYRKARLAHFRQEFQKADELYHEALKIADDELKKENITQDKHLTARTLMYDGLADIALKSGEMEAAEALYVQTMKGCIQQGMKYDDNAIIDISLKLCGIFAMQGKKEEAEDGFKFCISAQSLKMKEKEEKWLAEDAKMVEQPPQQFEPEELEEIEKNTAALLGMALGSYGRFLLQEKRFTEAQPLFERSRMYALHTLGTKSNQYIVVLNDLATLHIVNKDYTNADKALKNGIAISEEAKLSEVAMLYCNLGAVHLRKGETAKAAETCQTALERAKLFDHKMAFRMAEACLKKCAQVQAEDKSKPKE